MTHPNFVCFNTSILISTVSLIISPAIKIPIIYSAIICSSRNKLLNKTHHKHHKTAHETPPNKGRGKTMTYIVKNYNILPSLFDVGVLIPEKGFSMTAYLKNAVLLSSNTDHHHPPSVTSRSSAEDRYAYASFGTQNPCTKASAIDKPPPSLLRKTWTNM